MLTTFREETRSWLEDNCPVSMRSRMNPDEVVNGGFKRRSSNPDSELWLQRMAERGWTAPTWPEAYGGAGLDKDHFVILLEEMQRINARPPLLGMGVSMIGPTLLEYGTEAQKSGFLPPITRGEVAWCQGYSEPGAGSDLAGLRTRAHQDGDEFVVNGSKIWTSGAAFADWMFCLVRTDSNAPKHQGISFLLLPMDSPGVTVKPIRLINGDSPFYQTFFDDVRVPRENLVHRLNEGWEVGKRLLQHERSGLAALASADTAGPLERIKPGDGFMDLLRRSGVMFRDDWTDNEMLKQALLITKRRAVEELEAHTPGAATSIFKYVEAEYVKRQLELQVKVRGTQGLGWQGEMFEDDALAMCRLWLESKAISIAGGSNEIQLNIISKRVLGLPD